MEQPRRIKATARPAQSLVEFALTAPILVAIVVGIIELGLLFSAYIGLTNSAREGARAAAVYRYPGAAPFTGDTATVATVEAGRELAMSATITDTLNPLVASESVTTTLVYLPPTATATNPLRAGDVVSVTLQYRHTLLFGMLGDHELELKAQSAARIEPGGAQ